jgi:predicted lipoprotein
MSCQALADAPEDPDALEAAQSSWQTARLAWDSNRAAALGPIWRLRLAMDFRPTRTRLVKRLLNGPEIDPERITELPPAGSGLPAIEWLIYVDTEKDLATRARRAAQLAAGLQHLLKKETDRWRSSSQAARIALLASDSKKKMEHATVQEALDGLVNHVVALAAILADEGLAKPLGLAHGGDRRPHAVIAPYGGDSLLHLQAAYDGLGKVIEASIVPLMPERGQADGARLVSAFGKLSVELEKMSTKGQLRVLVSEQSEKVETLHADASAISTTLSTQIMALLGVTVRFGDSDGD